MWFLEAHPQLPSSSIPVLDGCQIDKHPDHSRWIKLTDRNDCATSPCQSCKWSRRPQVIIPDLYDHRNHVMGWSRPDSYCMISCLPSFCVISNHTWLIFVFVCHPMILMAKMRDLQEMNYMNSCKSLGRFNPLAINVRRHMAFQNISATSAIIACFCLTQLGFPATQIRWLGPWLVGWEMKTVAYYIKMCL